MPDTQIYKIKIGIWLFSLLGSLEAIVFFFSGLWGFWLVSPWWDAFGTSITFCVMALTAPRWVWGGVPLLLAVLLLVCSVMGWRQAKRVVMLGMVFFWTFVWAAFAMGNLHSTATASYLLYSSLYAWLWYMNGGAE